MTPQNRSDNDPSNPDRLEVYAGLLADVSRLINEVEADQRSQGAASTFSFENPSGLNAVIPAAVKEHVPDLDHIDVTLTKDSDEDHPSLVSISVDFSSKTKLLTVSRTGEETVEEDTSDLLIDTTYKMPKPGPLPHEAARKQLHAEREEEFTDRITEVARMTKEEFNKLIMSLVYPNEERGYAMFSDVDFFSPRAYESLRDSFYLAAIKNHAVGSYIFESAEVVFTFSKHDDQPTSFTLTYPEKYFGQPITAKSDFETDFKLRFNTIELAEPNPFSSRPMPKSIPYYPTIEEIAHLRSIIETEIMVITPPEADLADDEYASPDDPATRFEETKGHTVISKTYVKGVLDTLFDQDSLNPPDAGAA